MHWGIVKSTGPRTLKIGGEADYCWGTRPWPKIERVTTSYRGKKVYVTTEATPPAEGSPNGRKCIHVGLPIYRDVTLDRSLRGSLVYDASTDPPALRWPEGAADAAEG
jgi:hypothetical protein